MALSVMTNWYHHLLGNVQSPSSTDDIETRPSSSSSSSVPNPSLFNCLSSSSSSSHTSLALDSKSTVTIHQPTLHQPTLQPRQPKLQEPPSPHLTRQPKLQEPPSPHLTRQPKLQEPSTPQQSTHSQPTLP